MRALAILAGLIGGALMPSSAFAWGDVGHRVVCQIAYDELKPEIKARVDALVAIDPKFRTFPDACTAPDHPQSARLSIMWTWRVRRRQSR